METIEILNAFLSLECSGCGGAKKKRNAFCLACYRQLPPALRRCLWKRIGSGFEEAYQSCLSWFREHPLQGEHRVMNSSLRVVAGRQRVVRHGIFFTVIGKRLRAVYMQVDGKVVLADECKCFGSYSIDLGYEISRSAECPINEHQILAIKKRLAMEAAS